MEFVSRANWGARNPKYVNRMASSEGIFVHHTAGNINETPRQIQNYHMDSKGWADIAYSWCVDHNGVIYEGRGWGVNGGHTAGWNSRSHAVVYIGNTNEAMTGAGKIAVKQVVEEYERRFGKGFVLGHRDVNSTACPGNIAYDWVRAGMPTDGTGPAPVPQPTPIPAPRPDLNNVIYEGSHPEEVKLVQQVLVFWNMYPANQIDGIWGPKTAAGVKQLQTNLKAAGFNPGVIDGIWGPGTNKAYQAWLGSLDGPNPPPVVNHNHFKYQTGRALRKGLTGNDVKEWQFLLNYSNDDKRAWITVDGQFGPRTERATMNFQSTFRIFFGRNIAVDGIVGDQTRAAMTEVMHAKDLWE